MADVDAAAAQRLAEACGAQALSLDEAFAADAVLIGSPTPTHADYIERAAAAGRAIFCEKPIDLSTPSGCAPAWQRCRRAGVPLMVGFNRRFDPHFATLKRRMDAGEIGALELLTIISRDPGAAAAQLHRDVRRAVPRHDDPRSGHGAVPAGRGAGGGASRPPPAWSTRRSAAAGDVDTAVVTLRTASGKLCQISNSRRATYGYDQRIEAHGAEGLLRAGNVTADDGGAGERRRLHHLIRCCPSSWSATRPPYRAELDAFITAVTAGQPVQPDGEDGLQALLLADAATHSAHTGDVVRL